MNAILPRLKRFFALRVVHVIKERGLRPAFRRLKRISRFLRGKHRPNYILRRRRELGNQLAKMFGATVRYGPFKGLRLSGDRWWGADTASMLLGIYEQEVLQSLQRIPKTRRTFIDLGAADGYYGLGVLINGLFDFSYCFERSPAARKFLLANARLNNVSDKVRVLATATSNLASLIAPRKPSESVLLVDIEGAEFELFDESLLEEFNGAIIFIELHDWFYADGDLKLEKLRRLAERYFRITEFTTSARDLSPFEELARFSDDDRWIICSEGRGQRMNWWRLDPLHAFPAAN